MLGVDIVCRLAKRMPQSVDAGQRMASVDMVLVTFRILGENQMWICTDVPYDSIALQLVTCFASEFSRWE